jgi:hypothetical protein
MRHLTIAFVTASMLIGGAAIAQTSQMGNDSNGDTSTSTKGNITPSTAVQKNRSSATDKNGMGSPAAGSPGVEGPAGSENGPSAKTNKQN